MRWLAGYAHIAWLRTIQASDKYGCATPADWQSGEDVIVPPPGSCGTAKERMEKPDPDACALDWFMTFEMSSPHQEPRFYRS